MRPTSDRARQALFNILEHGGFVAGGGSPLRGATVLDAFAGTGALGLEALSRGAVRATFMDTGRAALDAIRRNVEACRETTHAALLRADATHPPRADAPCTVVFLDPPYHSGHAAASLAALAAAGWFAPGAICCVEIAADETCCPPSGFQTLDERRYGVAHIVLMRFGSNRSS